MSIFEKITRFDRCVYWAPGQPDAHGNRAYGDPVELGCRWDDEQDELITKDGHRDISIATVYVTALPDGRDVVQGGAICHALLTANPDFPDLPVIDDTANPFNNPDTFPIKAFDKTGSINQKKQVRKVYI